MRTLRSIAIATGFIVTVLPPGPGAVNADATATNEVAPESGLTPAVEFQDMPDDFVQMAEWATGLFEEADLDLPPIRFVHHGDETTACEGRRGAHRHVDGRSVVDICTSDVGPVVDVMILHETAHAWAEVGLTDERKAAFQQLRGWDVWRNHADFEWYENGSEQAAEMMVWGLVDRPLGIVTIHDTSCDDLEAGYRTLTGQAPLHGFRDICPN